MKKLNLLILSLALITGIFTSCSTTPKSDDKSSKTESSQSTNNESTWPKTIVDGAGNKIVLEKKPEKITLLHVVYMEHLLLLDTPPTAAAIGNALGETEGLDKSELYKPYLKNTDIKVVGNSKNINLEAILESKPDLLLTFYNPQGLEMYDQLSEIAPVAQLDFKATWQNQLLKIGEILGKDDDAKKHITEIESEISKAKDTLSKYKDRTIGVFRTDGKNFIPQGNAKYYDAFGITRPNGFPTTASLTGTSSLEAVAEMNPYYIVFQHNEKASKAFVNSLESSSVWKSMDAVKNGRVYYFDENMNSYGPLTLKLASEKLTEIYSK